MALRIQITKFILCQYLQSVNSPNLMLAKLSCYTVLLLSEFVSSHFSSTAIIANSVKINSLQSNLSPMTTHGPKVNGWNREVAAFKRGGGGGIINTVIPYCRKIWQALNLLNWLISVGIGWILNLVIWILSAIGVHTTIYIGEFLIWRSSPFSPNRQIKKSNQSFPLYGTLW